MNRKELIEKVSKLKFDKNDFWLVTGGAMVLHGIKEETADIDLGCTTKLADELEVKGCTIKVLDDGTRKIKYKDIEIFEGWLYDTIEFVDNIPVITIKGLKMMKQKLGRPKDLKDIELIVEFQHKNIKN